MWARSKNQHTLLPEAEQKSKTQKARYLGGSRLPGDVAGA